MKEAAIERLVCSWKAPGMIYVVLKDKAENRRLFFGVDLFVGHAIVQSLERLPSPRPLPHDLIAAVLTTLHGTIRHVVITELKEKSFRAKIVLDHSGGSQELDARPSDAVALAIKAKAPIFVEDALLARVSTERDLSKLKPFSSLWPFAQDISTASGGEPSRQE